MRAPEEPIAAGQSFRFDCGACSMEWEVTYEPKVRGDSRYAAGMEPVTIKDGNLVCPNCGHADDVNVTDA